ncbi:hypothetical protein F8N49_26570, partial [Pseudomonas sp. GXM4]
KDLHDESHTKTNNNAAWVSAKGRGNTDETLRQTQMIAKGNIVLKAVDGLKIDIKDVSQESVSQTIDAMVKADPQLAWLKDAEARGDVDWRRVKEIHESFKYENSGVGPAAQIAIAIMMSFVMGPAGLGLVGGGFGGAFATTLATTGVTSTISNKGNLGAAFKETFSADSLKNAAIAGFTAGMLDYADANWFTAGGSKAASILTSSNFTDVAIRTAGRAFISSGISTTIGGGSFADNFGSALLGEAGSVAMATGFNFVGDQTIKFPEGGVVKVVAHALMGGLISEVTGGDFATGAAAAGLNEAAMNTLVKFAAGNDQLQVMLSQLTGVLAAALVDGNSQLGASIAGSATTYNYLYHREVKEMLAEMDSKTTDKEKLAVRDKYEALDKQRELELDEFCKGAPDTCRQISHDLADDDEKFSKLIATLRSEGKSGEAYWVGVVQGGNLNSTGSIASIVNLQEGGFFAKLGAVAIQMGGGIFPGRATGKGTTATKEADVKGTGGVKGNEASKAPVQELEVDSYKNLKSREVVADGLEHDHIPSFAALRTAKEAELGRPLTEVEAKSLYQNATAVEVPRDVHIAGPTYGGKNTRAQVQQDAIDLCGAVCRDTDALRENLRNRGYDSKIVDETIKKIVERNREIGVIK